MKRVLSKQWNNTKPKVFLVMVMAILFAGTVFSTQANSPQRKIKKEIQSGFITDEQGNLVSDSSQIIKNYDINGNVAEEIESSIWPVLQKRVTYYRKNFFNQKGKLDSAVTYIDDKLSLKLLLVYDSTGRESIIKQSDAEGHLSYWLKNIYNALNQKSRVEMYSPNGKLHNFTNYVYGAHNNVREQSATEMGTPRYRWAYKYDKKNRLIERRDYSGQKVFLFKHRYEYNADGRLTKETTLTPKGTIDRVVTYRYEFYENN